MKIKIGRFLLMLMLLTSLWSFTPSSQPISADLKKLSAKLAEHKYEAEIELILYQGDPKGTILEKKNISVCAWKNYMYYKAGDMEFIANEKVQVVVNHKAKVILVNKNNLERTQKAMKDMIPVLIDSVLLNNARLTVVAEKGELQTIRITQDMNNEKISFVDFTYSKENFSPARYLIQYNQPMNDLLGTPGEKNKENAVNNPSLALNYSLFRYLTAPVEGKFEVSKFIDRQKDGTYRKNAAFQKYELLDYSTLKSK